MELRRRRVLRACAMYIVAAWVAVQVAGMLFPAIGVPEEALLFVWLIGVALLPLVVVFSWRYDFSTEGISRTPPARPGDDFDPSLRRVDLVLLAALGVLALTVLLEFGMRIESGAIRLDTSISPFSIAVLPFDDLSGNPDEQYFVSGMQSSLIDGLSRVRNLRVTSKVSTLPYRQAGGALLEIATQLGVARIVEGTVLRNGGRVSIALRMHDVEKGQQVWSSRFEDNIENILLLQARAAQEIANQVHAQLGPEEREQFAAVGRVNPEAYNAFLRGVFHVERFNHGDIRIAEQHFRHAVDVDPGSALGHWGLGKLCLFQAQTGMLMPKEARKRCLQPILRALELDPFLAEAHRGLATTATWLLFDWDAAGPHWERALELNPSLAEAQMFFAHYLGIIGELDRSTVHAEIAVKLDPLNPFMIGLYSVQLVMREEYVQAIEAAEKALGMAPGYAFGYVTLWIAHDMLGNEEEAIRAVANLMRFTDNNHEQAALLEADYEQLGYEGATRQAAARLIPLVESGRVRPISVAMLYQLGGDYESAIDWFEISAERFDPDAPYFGVSVKHRGVRTNPRFMALLERMGLDYWASHP